MRTAVEWLYEELKENNLHTFNEWKKIFEQAKQMEKEQMLKTFTESRTISVECAVWNCQGNERKWESFEQYYNETFKK